MKFVLLVVGIVGIFVAQSASAGQVTGNIRLFGSWTFTGPDRQLLLLEFMPGSSITSPAPCSASTSNLAFAFDLSTVKGRVALQMVQSAMITGLVMRMGGYSTCTLAPGYEDGDFVQILPLGT